MTSVRELPASCPGNGDELVKAAAEKFSNVVVIVHTVGPILMEEWIELR
jgi:beta-glucosidase